MEDSIKKAIQKYANTLKNLGYINPNEGYNILAISFIQDFIRKGYIDSDNIKVVSESLDLTLRNSCVFSERFICVTLHSRYDRFTYTFPFTLKDYTNLCEHLNQGFTYTFEFNLS